MDWRGFINEYAIPFREGGKSSKRGNIYIKCPFCIGENKLLLGLEENSNRWGCWKDAGHRGKSPAYLVQTILQCSPEEAASIVGAPIANPSIDALRERFNALGGGVREKPKGPETVELPKTCFPLVSGDKLSQRFFSYLRKRGLPEEAASHYNLHGCDYDPALFWRLVIPIYKGVRLIGYTARSIVGARQRYHTVGDVGESLLNTQHAQGGEFLAVVEGPTDALKLDWVAHEAGLPSNAVALGGLGLTPGKIQQLFQLKPKYAKIALFLDSSAVAQALQMQRELPFQASIGLLPSGISDPGALSLHGARAVIGSFLN